MTDLLGDFDFTGYYRALDGVRIGRGMNWKQVSEATNVGQSTLARMGKGKRPDADALAALSAWAGLNPADFVPNATQSNDRQDTLAEIYSCLRRDPNLSAEATAAIDEIIKVTYERLRRKA